MLTYAYAQEGALEALAEALSRHCVCCRMLTYAYVQEGAFEEVAEALSRHCAACEDVAMRALDAALAFARYALYLLYWYKSTNTDAMWR
jgi:hypothetical protein